MSADLLAAAGQQLPEDVGKSGPLGLLLTLLLLIAVFFLVRSMSKHLKRVPRSFEPTGPGEQIVEEIPDTPAELLEPRPGQQVLDELRRAPRAIESRRPGEERADGPTPG